MLRKLTLVLMAMLVSVSVQAAIKADVIEYREGGTVLKGYLAYDDSIKSKRPGVLVVHEWWGHNPYARKRARMLAEQGYTALAVDMYGDGKLAKHPEDAKKFSSAVGGKPALVKARFIAALKVLNRHATVDSSKTAAIGYCFGGKIVLEMARAGVDLDGVAAFHGSVATKNPAQKSKFKAKVRVYNGADDPFIKPETIAAFKKEMESAGIDYQFVNYPGAKHSFTNPDADEFGKKFKLPLAYHPEADKKSWDAMLKFFKEIF